MKIYVPDEDYRKAVKQAAAALKRADQALWEVARLSFWNATPDGLSDDRIGGVGQWSRDVQEAAVVVFAEEQARSFAQRWLDRVDNPPASFMEGCNPATITPLPAETREGRAARAREGSPTPTAEV